MGGSGPVTSKAEDHTVTFLQNAYASFTSCGSLSCRSTTGRTIVCNNRYSEYIILRAHALACLDARSRMAKSYSPSSHELRALVLVFVLGLVLPMPEKDANLLFRGLDTTALTVVCVGGL